MLLFDHQTFFNQKYGGISKYYSQLILNNTKLGFKSFLNLKYSDNFSFNLHLKNLNIVQEKIKIGPPVNRSFGGLDFQGKGILYKLIYGKENLYKNLTEESRKVSLDQAVLSSLRSNNFRIFHPTYYSDYFLETISELRIPFVLTVYDMIHEIFPHYFTSQDEVIRNKKKLCEASSLIFTISQSTKKDLIEIYGIDSKKIVVTPLAHEWSKITRYLPSLMEKDFILFVGDRWTYKNFKNFVKAVSPILSKFNLQLICSGSSSFDSEELFLFNELGISDRVFHRTIDKEVNLYELYERSILFVFPSLYEGFGLPLLEAQSLGTPIACSNTSSFPEVAGEGALFFDPNNLLDIRNTISEVVRSSKLREELSKKGLENFRKYSWKNVSETSISAYKSLL